MARDCKLQPPKAPMYGVTKLAVFFQLPPTIICK